MGVFTDIPCSCWKVDKLQIVFPPILPGTHHFWVAKGTINEKFYHMPDTARNRTPNFPFFLSFFLKKNCYVCTFVCSFYTQPPCSYSTQLNSLSCHTQMCSPHQRVSVYEWSELTLTINSLKLYICHIYDAISTLMVMWVSLWTHTHWVP